MVSQNLIDIRIYKHNTIVINKIHNNEERRNTMSKSSTPQTRISPKTGNKQELRNGRWHNVETYTENKNNVTGNVTSVKSDFSQYDNSQQSYDDYYDSMTDALDVVHDMGYMGDVMNDYIVYRDTQGNPTTQEEFIEEYAQNMSQGIESPKMYFYVEGNNDLESYCNQKSFGLIDKSFKIPEGWEITDDYAIHIDPETLTYEENEKYIEKLKDAVESISINENSVLDEDLYEELYDKAAQGCLHPVGIHQYIEEQIYSRLEEWNDDHFYTDEEETEESLYKEYDEKFTPSNIRDAFHDCVLMGEVDMSQVQYNRSSQEFNLEYNDFQRVCDMVDRLF